MIYLRWSTSDIKGIEDFGLSAVVTECTPDGSVRREIGFDAADQVVHRAPDPHAKFFLFDLQSVLAPGSDSCMSGDEFTTLWEAAAARSNNSFKPKPLRGSA